MSRAIRTTAVVQQGGRIEITSPDLEAGARVDVILMQRHENGRRALADIVGDYRGGELFKTAAEVDEYLRQERESWGQ